VTRSNIVTAIAVLVLLAALPSPVRDTIETGRLYLFSRQFIEELPQRFTDPGRFRFILQPSIAILIGLRGGLADTRAGRPHTCMDCSWAGRIAGIWSVAGG